jgi:DNA-binding transcriptional LysR family regulator
MGVDLADLNAFVAVAQARGFRDGARTTGASASGLSEAVRRLEAQLGVRLLNRTTRSVMPTEAGARLLARLGPALGEVESALDVVNSFRDRPAGTLRLNVPISAARLVLPAIVPGFLAAFPEIVLEVTAEDGFVDVLAAGCDAGIRYGERLEQDVIAVPIGPRTQRFMVAAAPAYLAAHGAPREPEDLLNHRCIRHRFLSGMTAAWEFERDGRTIKIAVHGPLVSTNKEIELDAAVRGLGLIYTFEELIAPALAAGTLVQIMDHWAQSFPGPYLYYASRRHMPAPLRAFVDFIKIPALPAPDTPQA